MRHKDVLPVAIVDRATPPGDGPSPARAARSPLPPALPRPVKITRGRTRAVPPPAHIRRIGGTLEDTDRDEIARTLGRKFGKFASSIERITVRFSDVNGPKGGRDRVARIKVVLSAQPSVVVEERDATFPRALDRAVNGAALAVRRTLHRRRLKPLHHRAARAQDSASS